MNGRTDSRTRSLVMLAALVLVGVTCIARLAYWQVLNHDRLASLARAQVTVNIEEPPVRGTVYDRSGTEVLATTVERDRVVADAAQIKGRTDAQTAAQRETIASQLVALVGLPPDQAAALRAQLATGKAYVVLARDLTPGQSAAVRSAIERRLLPQVSLETDWQRTYPVAGGAPKTSLAAQLLGFVNADGTGQYGIEGRWQQALAGTPKVIAALRDGSGRPAVETGTVVTPGTAGSDLILTIDGSLQLKLEQEVYAAWVADRAKSVSAIVMDPRTGEVLASATYPSYDANSYRTVAAKDPARFVDPVISSVYEPGSVFKMATATAALGAGVVTRSTKIADQAVLTLDGGRASVRNADRGSKGTLTFQDAVAWSRNVIMSKVALRLGSTTLKAATVLHDTWTRLGFGKTTGIDLAGEVAGIVRDPATNDWQQIDLANGSFGQGVAVTLIQLATAYCAMVNGGLLPTPHVVQTVGGVPVQVPASQRVMSAALSRDLIAIMKRVVVAVPFYKSRTEIPGYVVGGKTGTAQIWDAKKRAWRTDAYNFSFAGFVGRTSPELVIAVRVTEGHPIVNRPGDLENAVESFVLFRRIATDAMSTLGLPPVAQGGAGTPKGPKATAHP